MPYKRGKHCEPTVLLQINMPRDLRVRFRIAALKEDMTYAQMVEMLMDRYEHAEQRQRRRMAHPLYVAPEDRPGKTTSLYPGEAVKGK